MWKGQITFETPMLWACGFLVTFLFGGLTGVILAVPALDFHALPRIRSERPAFELHHPEMVKRLHDEAHPRQPINDPAKNREPAAREGSSRHRTLKKGGCIDR
jgi:hypothetical protein